MCLKKLKKLLTNYLVINIMLITSDETLEKFYSLLLIKCK